MTKTYHTSLYTIFLKTEEEAKAMLVHGYTGAMDIVSAKVADFLRKGGQVSAEALVTQDYPFSEETLNRLVRRGYLTEKSPFEERDRVRSMADLFHKRDFRKRKFLFLVAYDCNFRCPYCFENEVSDYGKGWSKKVFNKDMVDKAYAAMEALEPQRERHVDNITLYGGEPLLQKHRPIVEYIIEQGRERGYRFTAITNGYDLEHFSDLLGPGGIESLQVTVDGTPRVHDARRTHYQHGGSYEKIMLNLQLALDLGVQVIVRINTDVNNFEELAELKNDFQRRGCYNYDHFTTYSGLIHGDTEMNCNAVMASGAEASRDKEERAVFRPLDSGSYNPDAQYIDFESEQQRFAAASEKDASGGVISFFHDASANGNDKIHTMNRGKYIRKYREAVEKDQEMHLIACQDFGLRSKVQHVLQTGELLAFSSVFCGAQTGMMIFDPYGELYTCWEVVGQEREVVGTYRDGLQIDADSLALWYGRNIGKTPACSSCKYAFFCGGGCMAGALREGRGYDSPYCDGYPKTFQEVVPQVYKEFIAAKQSPDDKLSRNTSLDSVVC